MMMLDNKLGARADEFYALLLDAHSGLEEAESHALNARLVLMLSNEIGDVERLKHLLEEARRHSAA
jgi:selenocysteine lyase/cysteine desulfurase